MSDSVDTLAACLAAAAGDDKKIRDCEKAFKDSGGRQRGGKVFADSAGGEIATTETGGKVFTPKQ